MIKVRLLQPGQPDVEVDVQGDSAVIGRDAKCDVVVPQPFVSKRHVQILRGLVVIDLRSANGTFVDGKKITGPQLLSGGLLNLAERLDVVVECADHAPASTSMLASRVDELGLVREQLESERARAAVLVNDLSELRRRAKNGGADGDAKLAALEGENRDLRKRLESAKEEIEVLDGEGAGEVRVRLLTEQVKELQDKNQKLAARARELEARSPGEIRPPPPETVEELQRLRAELERARQAVMPPSELFAQLHRENQELRERLLRFESGEASAALPATELFFQLQDQIRDLQRQLEEARRGRGAPKTSRKETRDSGEVQSLRTALAVSEAELSRLRRDPEGVGGESAAVTGSVLRIARLVVERDAEGIDAKKDAATAEDFLVLEGLCFLRKTEKLVTRLAGRTIQILNPDTLMPGVKGNFRSLTDRLLTHPNERGARIELAQYLKKLTDWLVFVVGAPQQAALDLVTELKRELSEEGLTEGRPISGIKIVPGQRDAELWKRACEHLKELTPEVIEDRLERLARRTAEDLLKT